MALGSGVRDTAGLCESQYCNLRIKKEHKPTKVNLWALKHLEPEQVEADICLVQLSQKVEVNPS